LGTTGRGWDMRPAETRDVDFVRAVLDRLEYERCVDRRRIFATGMSNGGFFANLLGCTLAERLAAIAPVAGALDLGSCVPARPMPVLLLYGRADRVVPAALIAAARAWWARADHCATAAADGDCEHYTGCAADLVYCEGPQAPLRPARGRAGDRRRRGRLPRPRRRLRDHRARPARARRAPLPRPDAGREAPGRARPRPGADARGLPPPLARAPRAARARAP